MALRKHVCHAGSEHRNLRLDRFLAEVLPEQVGEISRREVRRLIEAGAVYLDGSRVRVASRRVQPAARLEVLFEDDPSGAPPPAGAVAGIEAEQVLFEDEFLIAVDKPPGVPSQATRNDARNDLASQVRRFLKARDDTPAPYLALHHRLDRGTSGVMLFAKHRRVNRTLAHVFAESRVHKLYHALAVVAGDSVPDAAWTVKNRLSSPQGAAGSRRVVAVGSGGRSAETELRPLRFFPGAVWVEALPKTGRTHQIRVHLAGSGLPVLGDRLYGRGVRPRIAAPRLMLHAVSLTLEHPATGEPLVLESPLPEDFREQVRVLELGYVDE